MTRKSAASMTLAGIDGRPAPPLGSGDREKALWTQFVAAMPTGWFGPETWPLLQALCAHAATFEEIQEALGHVDDLSDPDQRCWFARLLDLRRAETACIASLTTKLRCSPQSRYTPQRAGSALRGHVPRAPGTNRFTRLGRKSTKK